MSIIKVENVHKKFKVYYDKGQSLKERLLFRNRNHYEDRWVLKGISFEVGKGEAIGLIGENGCGKSTMLKIMTRIMYPDQGSIQIKGRVSSLIELGAGFHPDMSGKENIYTNAAIFGLTKKEIDARLEDIINFSELRDFIDNPVRTYSSGMYMRLAFSVAINVSADVLLIDEILAVGDTNFQIKCFNKLRELKSKGVTIVIVTHDSNVIETFCNQAIWIDQGKMRMYDKAPKVVDAYLNHMNEKRFEKTSQEIQSNIHLKSNEPFTEATQESVSQEVIGKSQDITIEYAIIRNHMGQETLTVKGNELMSIEIHYESNIDSDEYVFGIGICSLDDVRVYGTHTFHDSVLVPVTKGKGSITFRIKDLKLLSGQYKLQLAISYGLNEVKQFIRDYTHFEVVSTNKAVGLIDLEHSWEVKE